MVEGGWKGALRVFCQRTGGWELRGEQNVAGEYLYADAEERDTGALGGFTDADEVEIARREDLCEGVYVNVVE